MVPTSEKTRKKYGKVWALVHSTMSSLMILPLMSIRNSSVLYVNEYRELFNIIWLQLLPFPQLKGHAYVKSEVNHIVFSLTDSSSLQPRINMGFNMELWLQTWCQWACPYKPEFRIGSFLSPRCLDGQCDECATAKTFVMNLLRESIMELYTWMFFKFPRWIHKHFQPDWN